MTVKKRLLVQWRTANSKLLARKHEIDHGPAEIKVLKLIYLGEASHIDFVHEKRHIDVGGGGGGWGLTPVTFLGEKSWKISIVL